MNAHLTMADVIRMGASRREMPKPCPYCGEDPPLASRVAGRFIIACETDGCDTEKSGATLEEAWSKWNRRAQR